MESGTRLRFVAIELKPDRLFPYFEEDTPYFPAVLRKIVAQKYDDVSLHIENITPTTQIALHQIVNCPYRGITRKLFLESRALELIGYQLNQTSETKRSGITPHIMHPCDRKRTEFEKSILVRNIENPPNLKELARATAMSAFQWGIVLPLFSSASFSCRR